MLYKIDLRLREITQKDMPFGNVAILAFGDLMQIKPVKGRYIMQCPVTKQFWIAYEIDSLWHKFECIILENNHRQGEDKEYANMLNRIRIGMEIPDDIEKLKERVRNENHPDIRKEKDALYIFGTNAKVNQMNNRRLKTLKGEEKEILAICLHKTMKHFSPHTNSAGNISNTPFQKELKIKIGAKVMLTYNLDTSDGLTNGARGDLIGVIEDEKQNISKLIIKFEVESFGKDKRRKNPGISKKYPGGTLIEKVNFSFSISKSKSSVINTANVIQFPVKLAFACTAHKIQGATVHKPMKIIIDVMDIWMAAITYVMLSRICSICQLYILNEFDESKMYPNQQALKELERLKEISLNNNPSEWEKDDSGLLKISSLNCRSLKKHYEDISSDELLLKSDIICLQETWLEDNIISEDLLIPNYTLHLNSQGKGKGIAIYFKKGTVKHEQDITDENMQISKFNAQAIDIVVLYRSQNGNQQDLIKNFKALNIRDKPQLIIGDFNFCFKEGSLNPTLKYLQDNEFKQLIKEATQIEGNLLDQAHVRDVRDRNKYIVEVQSKYYSDHKGLAVVVKTGMLLFIHRM